MLRILVADDAPIVRAGIKLLLETHEGWNVCGEAEDGEDAVQKAFALNPDVVLLDVAMPNLNGIDAAEIIKKYLPSATIYFVTRYDSHEMARATEEVGARGYISKIHIPTDLVPAIGALLAQDAHVEFTDFVDSWNLPVIFIFLGPLIGMAAGLIMPVITSWIVKRQSPRRVDKWFRRLQLVSAGADVLERCPTAYPSYCPQQASG